MKQCSRWWFSSFATCLLLTIVLTVVSRVWAQTSAEPIIDMHLHAKHADLLGTHATLYFHTLFDLAGQGHS